MIAYRNRPLMHAPIFSRTRSSRCRTNISQPSIRKGLQLGIGGNSRSVPMINPLIYGTPARLRQPATLHTVICAKATEQAARESFRNREWYTMPLHAAEGCNPRLQQDKSI